MKTDIYKGSRFSSERNALFSMISDGMLKGLRKCNAIVAGGTLTSLFSNQDANDIDLYFRNQEDMQNFILFCHGIDGFESKDHVKIVETTLKPNGLEELEEFDPSNDGFPNCSAECINIGRTSKSVMYTGKRDHTLQVIVLNTFESPADIFKRFDWTINMAAYDFAKDEFEFQQDFLKDLSQRRLCINVDTLYPIISLLRVAKYQVRGFKISKKDMLKLAVAITKLDISSWDEAKDQLSGMYGASVETVFETNQEFSTDNLYGLMEKVEKEYERKEQVNAIDMRMENWFTILQGINSNIAPEKVIDKGYIIVSSDRYVVMPDGKELESNIYQGGPLTRKDTSNTIEKTSPLLRAGITGVGVFFNKESAVEYAKGVKNRWNSTGGQIILEVTAKDPLNISAEDDQESNPNMHLKSGSWVVSKFIEEIE